MRGKKKPVPAVSLSVSNNLWAASYCHNEQSLSNELKLSVHAIDWGNIWCNMHQKEGVFCRFTSLSILKMIVFMSGLHHICASHSSREQERVVNYWILSNCTWRWLSSHVHSDLWRKARCPQPLSYLSRPIIITYNTAPFPWPLIAVLQSCLFMFFFIFFFNRHLIEYMLS